MKKESIIILTLVVLITILGYILFLRESEVSISTKNDIELESINEDIDKPKDEITKEDQQCNPNWICEDWSMGKYGACSEEGNRIRECRDLNNCNTDYMKPDTVIQCEAVRYNPPKLGPFQIEIIGDQYCKDRVNEALDFMKERSPKFYTKVITYVGVIECTNKNMSYQFAEEIPRVTLADIKFFRTVTQLASTLIHEAHHSELHIQYRVKNKSNDIHADIYSGKQAEEQCVNEEIKFLKEVNAPADEIYYTENKFEIEGEWWENPE